MAWAAVDAEQQDIHRGEQWLEHATTVTHIGQGYRLRYLLLDHERAHNGQRKQDQDTEHRALEDHAPVPEPRHRPATRARAAMFPWSCGATGARWSWRTCGRARRRDPGWRCWRCGLRRFDRSKRKGIAGIGLITIIRLCHRWRLRANVGQSSSQ